MEWLTRLRGKTVGLDAELPAMPHPTVLVLKDLPAF